MKILVGSFQCESNTFSAQKAGRDSFHILYGEEAVNALAGCRLLKESGAEIVPMVYAVSLPSGEVAKDAYLGILDEFIEIAEKHTDADGVYLYFHGAMCVEELGSGEEYFIKELRKVLGDDIPISVACDFHSVITDKYAASINALSGYRTAPHTDYDETEYRAVRALLKIINENLKTQIVVERIPVLLADAAQTAFEPYKTALELLEKADADRNIVAASIFNGQPWVDSEFVGACVALTCSSRYVETKECAKDIADYFWENRDKIKFSVPALSPNETLGAVQSMKKPVFISDSGDNSTAGADGRSTFLLGKLMNSEVKNVLIASLLCEELYNKYSEFPVGAEIHDVISAPDDYSTDIEINGVIKGKGTILGFVKEEAGEGILVGCGNIDIIISNVRSSFISGEHFTAMGIELDMYDCVVLKIGYLWPEVQPLAASTVFCLTPGTSTNDFSTLNYQNLKQNYYYVK